MIQSGFRPWSDHNFNQWSPGAVMDRHAHPFLQSIQVLEGVLEVDWGSGWRSLGPGEVHVLPPRAGHRLRSPRGHRQFGLNFSPAGDERGLLAALLRACQAPLILRLPFPRSWERSLTLSPRAPGDLQALRLAHALEEYTLALIAALTPREESALASRLLSLFSEQLEHPLTVPEAARRLGISRAALQRLCQAHFSCGAVHLQERMRLERAAMELLHSDLPVGVVAERFGYPDLFRFSRSFKRVHGLSPLAWRRGMRARRI
jgi:AraC-like DNA-binding protein